METNESKKDTSDNCMTEPTSPHAKRWMEFVSNSENFHTLDPRGLYWLSRALGRIVYDAYQLEVDEQ